MIELPPQSTEGVDDEDRERRKEELYEMLRRHISDLMVAIMQAASHLRPFHYV